jgi:hypothetical protein
MTTLRLLQTYRGYTRGETIQATPQLAEYLVAAGIAEVDRQAGIFPAQETRKAEAAVASPRAEQR